MNALITASALGIDVQTIPVEELGDNNYVLGSYQPGSGSSLVKVARFEPFIIYHELAHAIHDRLFPSYITISTLLESDLVADFVAYNLCQIDNKTETTKLTTYDYCQYLRHDLYQVLSMASVVLLYILGLTETL